MKFSIFGQEIGLRPKTMSGVGLPARRSSLQPVGLHSCVWAHFKEEELLDPLTERYFEISM